MNLIPKVMLPIHQRRVIKILMLSLLSLLLLACSSSKRHVDDSDYYELINIQIERNLVNFEGESSLLSFDLNNYLDDYLKKIENDDFGFCDTCGIEIGIKRLEARPTADQCIDCKTLAEIKEKQLQG